MDAATVRRILDNYSLSIKVLRKYKKYYKNNKDIDTKLEYLRLNIVEKQMEKLKESLLNFQSRLDRIEDEKEIFVLHNILDGLSNTEIAQSLGVSETQIRRIKEKIVQKLCDNS